MGDVRGKRLNGRDYVVLVASLLLAALVWLIHNLSLTYSDVVQCPIGIECELEGHSNRSINVSELAVRCEMMGYSLASMKMKGRNNVCYITVQPDEMRQISDEIYCINASNLTKYFHEVFGDDSKLEYFITDSLIFRFPLEAYKKVPVVALSNLSFCSQYMAGGALKIVPDSVLVYGEEHFLDEIEDISTEVICLSDIDKDVYGEIKIEKPKNLRVSLDRVDYSLQVFRYVENVLTLPVTMAGAPADMAFQFFPDEAEVRVRSLFPGNVDLSGLTVTVNYDEFVASADGKCFGRVENCPDYVLETEMKPEVFDCLIKAQ